MNQRSATYGAVGHRALSFSVAVARSLTEALRYHGGGLGYLLGGILRGLCTSCGAAACVPPLLARYLVGCGTFSLAAFSFYVAIGLAADRLQLLEVGLVNYLWTVLTVLLSVPILGKRAGSCLLPGVVAAAVGTVLVLTQGGGFSCVQMARHVLGNPMAYGAALVAAVTWALYSNLCRRWGKGNQEGAVVLFMCVTGAVLLGVRLLLTEPTGWSVRTLIEVLFLASTSTAGYAFWDVGVRRGDFVVISTSSYFTPLLSSVVSCLYLGVMPGGRLWAGCLLIIMGAWVSRAAIHEGGADSPSA